MIEGTKIFVGGLNYETTEDELEQIFSKYGEIINLRIVRDHSTGRSKGYAFITFESPESVEKSRELDNSKLAGRIIGVKVAKEKKRF